jgi:hypothetical protein
MLIEEKRFSADASWSQKQLFKMLNKVCNLDKKYKGIHLIQFENESPDDGWIKIDRKTVTKEQLMDFLRFRHEDWNDRPERVSGVFAKQEATIPGPRQRTI